MRQYQYPIFNSVVLAITLVVNYWSNTGFFNDRTIADVSSKYNNLLTPAGYAFSIWGIIYLTLIALVIYQWVVVRKRPEPVQKVGALLLIANFLNSIWVVVWLYDYLVVSVLVMIGLLVTLTRLNTRLAKWDTQVKSDLFLVHFPISLYQGWIIVALVANFSAFFKSTGFELLLTPELWAILVLVIAMAVYVFQTNQLNQVVSTLVGVWGISAIGVKQLGEAQGVSLTAFIVAGILLIYVLVTPLRKLLTN